jgi:phosphoribosyl 1,2-cyclic phosphodiesterase
MATELIFLGTGGGRFVTIDQKRATGGLYIIDGRNRLHLDPGPGALVRMHEHGLDPTQTNAVLVSHCHPDHYIDAEILIEAMTSGCRKKRGTVLASRSILDGIPGHGPAVSKYHQGVVQTCRVVEAGKRIQIGGRGGEGTPGSEGSTGNNADGTAVEVIPAHHSDSSAVGFRLVTGSGTITWGSDTRLEDDIYGAYSGSRVLILSVTTPLNVRIPYHLNTKDAADIAERCRPKLCILTHFGVRMLESGVEEQAKWVGAKTGVETVAAGDGMRVILGNDISISNPSA